MFECAVLCSKDGIGVGVEGPGAGKQCQISPSSSSSSKYHHHHHPSHWSNQYWVIILVIILWVVLFLHHHSVESWDVGLKQCPVQHVCNLFKWKWNNSKKWQSIKENFLRFCRFPDRWPYRQRLTDDCQMEVGRSSLSSGRQSIFQTFPSCLKISMYLAANYCQIEVGGSSLPSVAPVCLPRCETFLKISTWLQLTNKSWS